MKPNYDANQMKIKTIYNFQETCILCTLQCQERQEQQAVRNIWGLQYIGAGLQYIGAPKFYFQYSGEE